MAEIEFILASNSPRRRQLFAWTGWPYLVRPADIDETAHPAEPPQHYVARVAQEKARTAAALAAPGVLVLGSDTIVVDDGQILGKPLDALDARRMLRQLRGRAHTVYTALALYRPADGKMALDVAAAVVEMRPYSDAEIEASIASGVYRDKAGAYAIQDEGLHPVENFRDCYACVMGLPLCHLQRLAKRAFGQTPPADLPRNCQAGLNYACPVSAEILEGPDSGAFSEE